MNATILSLSAGQGEIFGAGPDGLFAVDGATERRIDQPQASLSSCAVAGAPTAANRTARASRRKRARRAIAYPSGGSARPAATGTACTVL